jgi:extracellular factor (EF) 3-hydroxypalmitic acid methyl ester biosynthesis protein
MQTSISSIVSANGPLVRYQSTLDKVYDSIRDGDIALALDDLFDDLSERREDEPHAWPEYARGCLNHPVHELLHQDPFTYRAFAKPRGYAGDAVMMDYIYGLGETGRVAREATPLGRAIFSHMATRPSARAVRYRRQLLADLIDRTASGGGRRVFALAAGHLREVEISSAARSGSLTELVAMDQDEASLATVAEDYARLGVRTMNGSVRQILSKKVNVGEFDFVYAAGLYDYLSGPVATALTCRLFEMTRPGGTMLIPNFLAGAPDSGYMEAFMDWHLIYRNHADMRALANALPSNKVASYDIFDDEDDTITFLLVSKAS